MCLCEACTVDLLTAAGARSGLGSLVSACAVVHASSAFSPAGAAQWVCAAVAWWTQWLQPPMGWTCASARALLLLMELFSGGVAGDALWCPHRLARAPE